jgi:hypothetical protein
MATFGKDKSMKPMSRIICLLAILAIIATGQSICAEGEQPVQIAKADADKKPAAAKAEPEKKTIGPRLRERHNELLEWLAVEDNYPVEAKRLLNLQESKPDIFEKQITLSLKVYGKIMDTEKFSPEMADIMKEELELTKKEGTLQRRIKATKDEKKKADLIEQLKETVSQKYDIILKRRQLAYEDLLKKLDELKEQINKRKAAVQRWKDPAFKKENITTRMNELLNGSEEFKWN